MSARREVSLQPQWSDQPVGLVMDFSECLRRVGIVLAPIALRIALALPFFKSGLTRWDGFMSLSASTMFLFMDMFKLHIFGAEYPLPMPLLLAYVTATAEITLPILVVLGLATRFSALGLLGMTALIQLVVPDGWQNFHLPWTTMALALIALGPGCLSADALLRRLFGPSARQRGPK
jgi:putative oxidoreductase